MKIEFGVWDSDRSDELSVYWNKYNTELVWGFGPISVSLSPIEFHKLVEDSRVVMSPEVALH